jgi:hypothetical protein
VSNVDNDSNSEHGVGAVADRVICTTARISPRVPDIAALLNGRLIEDVWPDAMVKLVAAPMVAPLALMNDTLPTQDAAVPLDDAVAVLVRLTLAVSVLPSPNGGRSRLRVVGAVVVVCANADASVQPATAAIIIHCRLNMFSPWFFSSNGGSTIHTVTAADGTVILRVTGAPES